MATANPYASVVGGNARFAGIDQGIDFTGPGPIYALDQGTVTRLQSSGSGWPGIGAILSYKLTKGPAAGRNVYVAEDFRAAAGIATGSTVQKGQVIGYATGTGQAPGIEIGWADASGRPTAPLPPPRPASQYTSEGQSFFDFVTGSSSGLSNPRLGNGPASSQGGSFSIKPISDAAGTLARLANPVTAGLGFLGGPGSGIAKWLGVPTLPKNALQRSAEMLSGAVLVAIAIVIVARAASTPTASAAPVRQTRTAVGAVSRVAR